MIYKIVTTNLSLLDNKLGVVGHCLCVSIEIVFDVL